MLPRRKARSATVDRSRRILIVLGSRTYQVDAARARGVVELASVTWLPSRSRLLSGVSWIDEEVVTVLDLSGPQDDRVMPRFGLRLRGLRRPVVVGAPEAGCFPSGAARGTAR